MVSDITSKSAFNLLKNNGNALLIDVRTKAELSYVGGPDLSDCKAKLLFCPIYEYPHMDFNPNFEEWVEDAIKEYDSEELYFICRSGKRSSIAARMLEEKGYKCYNIIDGFEGEPDNNGHRNTTGGWKASKLPWRQK